MGIVAFCPQGHRVKVKDHLAGKRGICPTCSERFQIPLVSADLPAEGGGPALPLAAIVSLDAATAAALPRALPLSSAAAPLAGLAEEPAVECELVESISRQHPLIAERPDCVWSYAVPGGAASPPLPADTMQAWLDARQATGAELVWRSDWPGWRPIGEVFPEYLGG